MLNAEARQKLSRQRNTEIACICHVLRRTTLSFVRLPRVFANVSLCELANVVQQHDGVAIIKGCSRTRHGELYVGTPVPPRSVLTIEQQERGKGRLGQHPRPPISHARCIVQATRKSETYSDRTWYLNTASKATCVAVKAVPRFHASELDCTCWILSDLRPAADDTRKRNGLAWFAVPTGN